MPGQNASSGSISRLSPRFVDRPPEITRPTLSTVQNSNREARKTNLRPPAFVAIKKIYAACFLQLAGRFNRTHVAINKYCSAKKNQRPRWGSRAETPTSGVAGAVRGTDEVNSNGGAKTRAGLNSEARPCNGNGEIQKGRLAACATNGKTSDTKQGEKHIKTPSTFVSVKKTSAVCFLQLTRNLNDTMFRLERIGERTKFKGRAQFPREDAATPPSHTPAESAKTIAGQSSCSAAGPIEKTSPLPFPATPGLPPARTSNAALAPARRPRARLAHRSAHPGRSSLTTSLRTASTAHTSDCSLLASLSHNGCRPSRIFAPALPRATYSAQSPAISWRANLSGAGQCPRPSRSG